MNLLKGAAPTAAPSFLPTTPHHQGLSMPWLPPRPFLSPPPPSGFIYAVAPATALFCRHPRHQGPLCHGSRHGPYCRRPPAIRVYLCRGSRRGPYCRRPSAIRFPSPITLRVRPCHRRAVAMSLSHCGSSTRCGSPPCACMYHYL